MRAESELQREERPLDTRGGDDGAVHGGTINGDAEHECVAAMVDAGRHLAVRVEVGANVQRANLCETQDTERMGV